MKNLVFITGVASDLCLYYESHDKKYFKFLVSAYHGDHDDAVLCVCDESKTSLIDEAIVTGETIDICGNIRARREEDGAKTVYVYASDVASSMPFTDEENSATGDAVVDKTPQVFANRTVVWVRLQISGGRFAYAPAVGYGITARQMAKLNIDDEFNYDGYVIATEDGTTCQLVIEDLKTKGEKEHENYKSHDAELQRDRRSRIGSQGHQLYQRQKPSGKDYGHGRSVRYSDRQDVRWQRSGQHSPYGRAWN